VTGGMNIGKKEEQVGNFVAADYFLPFLIMRIFVLKQNGCRRLKHMILK